MDQQEQSRWPPTRRQLLWAGGIAATVFVIVVICGYIFGWKWTGLPNRTLWDWLRLLIVPAVLAIGGYLFTRSENKRTRQSDEKQRDLDRDIADQRTEKDRKIAQERTETDRVIADQRRQDEMLQAYLEGMSQLLTAKEPSLDSAHPGDSLSTVARARTLTVLSRVAGRRKRSVLEFLYEAKLINKPNQVIELGSRDFEFNTADLSGADLRGAFLRYACLGGLTTGANLAGADLRGADLTGADLRNAILRGADLSDAILSGPADISSRGQTDLIGADLTSANLSGVRGIPPKVQGVGMPPEVQGITFNGEIEQQTSLLKGATMPDGQKYEDWLNSQGRGEDGATPGPS